MSGYEWVADDRSMTNETHATIPIPASAEVERVIVLIPLNPEALVLDPSQRHDVNAGGTEGADDPTPETTKDP
jgi:hypothetical protein